MYMFLKVNCGRSYLRCDLLSTLLFCYSNAHFCDFHTWVFQTEEALGNHCSLFLCLLPAILEYKLFKMKAFKQSFIAATILHTPVQLWYSRSYMFIRWCTSTFSQLTIYMYHYFTGVHLISLPYTFILQEYLILWVHLFVSNNKDIKLQMQNFYYNFVVHNCPKNSNEILTRNIQYLCVQNLFVFSKLEKLGVHFH